MTSRQPDPVHNADVRAEPDHGDERTEPDHADVRSVRLNGD